MQKRKGIRKAISKAAKSFLAYLLCCVISISPLLISIVSFIICQSIDKGKEFAHAEQYLQAKYPEESFTLVADDYSLEEATFACHFENTDGNPLTVYIRNFSIESAWE